MLKATKTVKSDHPSFKLIVGGDFNATVGKDCEPEKWACVGNNHDPDPTSGNGLRLLNYCREQELYTMNSFLVIKISIDGAFILTLVIKGGLIIFYVSGSLNVFAIIAVNIAV